MKKPEPSKETTTPASPTEIGAKLATWFPELSEKTLSQIRVFALDVIEANRLLSLIPSSTIPKIESLHLADAISGCRLISRNLIEGKPLFDFSGGSGFPGVIFAILYPAQKVVMLEREARRVEFLTKVIQKLALTNLTIQNASIDQLGDGSVTNLVTRGSYPLGKTLLSTRKALGKGGRYFHMRGDGWANELAQMPSQVFSHWAPNLLGQYRLPDSSTNMYVVLTEKQSD